MPTISITFNDESRETLKKNNLTEEEYLEGVRRFAGPYDTIGRFNVHDSAELMLETALKSIEACDCVFVTGVYTKGPEGVVEIMPNYSKIMRFLRSNLIPALTGTKKAYIIFLGPKESKAPHPKIIKGLLDGSLTLEGGLVIPGYDQPAAVTIITPGNPEMVTGVMGSIASNFHKFLRSDLTPRSIGCVPHRLESESHDLIDYPIRSPEQVIHLFKAAAAHLKPKYRQPGSEAVCQQVFEELKTEEDCKKQKKLGRSTKPSDLWFATSNKVNPEIMALNLALRVTCGDKALLEFMQVNREVNNRIVEAAIHGGDGFFSGDARDLAWGSMGGSAQVCFKPDLLIGQNDKIKGFFGKGIALMQDAMSGCPDAKEELELRSPPNQENMMESAAIIFETVWKNIIRGQWPP